MTDFRALCAELLSEIDAGRAAVLDRVTLKLRAALDEPEGEGLSLAEVDELCAEFGFHLDDDRGEGLEILQEMITAALARWAHPATPPAPEPGEVEELALKLRALRQDLMDCEELPVRSWGLDNLTRAATLLQQPSAITTEDLKND